MTAITELARAKVNLTLRVRGRRADGYHELESLITFADIGDRLDLLPGGDALVRATGRFADALIGTNLVETALARLAAVEPRLVLGSVSLEKSLPIAGGIGGGSADAAALLRAVRRANPALAGSVDWMGVAAALGADVPVCLASEPALVRGKGERLAPLPRLPRLAAVLVNPLLPVPADKTAQVFARLKAPSAAAPLPAAPTLLESEAALLAFMRAEGNDLLAPATAVVPEIAGVMAALSGVPGCRLAGLSGAGPTAFGIFATPGQARTAAAALEREQPGWWVAAVTLGP